MKRKPGKQVIGRRELVDFPELGLFSITAKIDTGAYTSVLHCHDIKVTDGILHFKFLDPSHPEYSSRDQMFAEFSLKDIKNSFGEVERRYTIRTIICMGGRRIKSLISLTDRKGMRYPVLIGRKLIGKKFIVDVSLVNTAGKVYR
jgi:hypothetical protein